VQAPVTISEQRTRAEAAIKRIVHNNQINDEQAKRADNLYTDAAAKFNGLIDFIAIAVKNRQDLDRGEVEAKAREAATKAEEFVDYSNSIPKSGGTMSPELLTQAVNAVVPLLVDNGMKIYNDWLEKDKAVRQSFAEDLNKLKWRQYSEIAAEK